MSAIESNDPNLKPVIIRNDDDTFVCIAFKIFFTWNISPICKHTQLVIYAINFQTLNTHCITPLFKKKLIYSTPGFSSIEKKITNTNKQMYFYTGKYLDTI